ncbi:MAG: hypothetical protein ACK48A_17430, partial [Pseudanabaena sp.]
LLLLGFPEFAFFKIFLYHSKPQYSAIAHVKRDMQKYTKRRAWQCQALLFVYFCISLFTCAIAEY